MAMVRISLALVILYDQSQIAFHNLITPLYAVPPDGYADNYGGWSKSLLGHGPGAAHLLFYTVVICAICMGFGFLTRLACATYVVVASQLAYLAPQGDRGIDMMIRFFVGILAFSQSNARFSIDAWIRRVVFRRPFAALVPAWPRYLLMLQLIWVYWSGGINKSGAEWGPFGGFLALANTLSDPHFARFSPGWLPTLLPVTRFATAVTVTFEVTAPIYLIFYYFADAKPTAGRIGRLATYLTKNHIRFLWMIIGASFHFGIAFMMRLGIFPFGMLSIYPALFFPEEIAAFLRRVRLNPKTA